ITVVSHGTVAKANGYALTVTDPAKVKSTVNLTLGNVFTANSTPGSIWTYSVDAQYRVPGSTNVWNSSPKPVTVTC
ncbi:hypothetical protein, partial [Pseudarthrobacter phenanthrenivorans]